MFSVTVLKPLCGGGSSASDGRGETDLSVTLSPLSPFFILTGHKRIKMGNKTIWQRVKENPDMWLWCSRCCRWFQSKELKYDISGTREGCSFFNCEGAGLNKNIFERDSKNREYSDVISPDKGRISIMEIFRCFVKICTFRIFEKKKEENINIRG
jgi:hypothetical protein